MKKNGLKKIAATIMCFVVMIMGCIVLWERPTHADSGFSTSYDSSSSSSSSSSYSSYDYGSSSYGDSDYSGDFSGFDLIIAIVVVIVIILFAVYGSSSSKPSTNITKTVNDDAIAEKIKGYIPNFDKKKFYEDGFKIYKDIQMAWKDFKLEDVKDVLTDELFNMYQSQLDTLEVKGEQNIMKSILMRNAYLKDVTVQNDNITITAGYTIEMFDYIIEQATGKVLRGSDSRKVRMYYNLKFRMTLDSSSQVTHCPNCGADVKINANGTCDYCGSKLVSENTKWVLTEKTVTKQEFV